MFPCKWTPDHGLPIPQDQVFWNIKKKKIHVIEPFTKDRPLFKTIFWGVFFRTILRERDSIVPVLKCSEEKKLWREGWWGFCFGGKRMVPWWRWSFSQAFHCKNWWGESQRLCSWLGRRLSLLALQFCLNNCRNNPSHHTNMPILTPYYHMSDLSHLALHLQFCLNNCHNNPFHYRDMPILSPCYCMSDWHLIPTQPLHNDHRNIHTVLSDRAIHMTCNFHIFLGLIGTKKSGMRVIDTTYKFFLTLSSEVLPWVSCSAASRAPWGASSAAPSLAWKGQHHCAVSAAWGERSCPAPPLWRKSPSASKSSSKWWVVCCCHIMPHLFPQEPVIRIKINVI